MIKPILTAVATVTAVVIGAIATLVEWIFKAIDGIADLFGIMKVEFKKPVKLKTQVETTNKNTIQDVISSIKEVAPGTKKEKTKSTSKASKLVSDISGGSGPKTVIFNIEALIKENTNVINNIRNEGDVKNFMDMLQRALLKVVNDSQIAVQ